jgi:hypothetical protein
MLWLRKGFGLSGSWTINDQNDLLARLFGLQKVNKHETEDAQGIIARSENVCDRPR